MKSSLRSFGLSLFLLLPVLAVAACSASSEPAPSSIDSEVISKAGKQACSAVGGSCMGLTPTSCPGNHWADATKVSCGTGVGVGCCLPECPVLSPPAPGFCLAGSVVPRINPAGCTTGYDCVPSCPMPSPPAPGFCSDGTIVTGTDTNGCTTYDCVRPTNACTAAGGACVGLAPASCPNGTWGDAATHGCGGGVGVGCCLPVPVKCPMPTPPAPGFCSDGRIVTGKDANGCRTYDCVRPTNACTAAGGACVGLAPASCPNGTWGDAATHSCGGGVGVGCCLP
jgi:hypothetical protein